MLEATRCPGCGTVPMEPRAEVQEARCVACGALLAPVDGDWNPYSAPSSPLTDPIDEIAVPMTIPRTVAGKFALTFRLLGANLVLISLIVLTVWEPSNIVIQSAEAAAPPGQEGMSALRLGTIFGGVFGPIVTAALISALSKRIRGERATYIQSMRAGFGNWGRVFAANLYTNLYVFLGMIALIVPGIILQVRYSLLDPVVVLERDADPRARSTRLTTGIRWPIFWSYGLYFAYFMPLSFGVWYLLDLLEIPREVWIDTLVECVLDIVGATGTIVMFLFYCEARQAEEWKKEDAPVGELAGAPRLPDFLRE